MIPGMFATGMRRQAPNLFRPAPFGPQVHFGPQVMFRQIPVAAIFISEPMMPRAPAPYMGISGYHSAPLAYSHDPLQSLMFGPSITICAFDPVELMMGLNVADFDEPEQRFTTAQQSEPAQANEEPQQASETEATKEAKAEAPEAEAKTEAPEAEAKPQEQAKPAEEQAKPEAGQRPESQPGFEADFDIFEQLLLNILFGGVFGMPMGAAPRARRAKPEANTATGEQAQQKPEAESQRQSNTGPDSQYRSNAGGNYFNGYRPGFFTNAGFRNAEPEMPKQDPRKTIAGSLEAFGLTSQNLTESSLAKVWKKRCRDLHPDMLKRRDATDQEIKDSEEKFKLLNEQHEILKKVLQQRNPTVD